MTTPAYNNWDDLPETAMARRIGRRMISDDRVTVVLLNLARGATLARHHHPHEQMVYLHI